MHARFHLTVLFALLPVASAFAAAPTPPAIPPYPDQKAPVFSSTDKAALAISSQWETEATMPAPGANGKVLFVFGANLPTVVCSPIQVTDIELEPGETVTSVNAGDNVRWVIQPAVSGSGDQVTTHLIIKPIASGLTTSLVIATDRRTYHIRLVSSDKDWMPFVAYSYPEKTQAAWNAYMAAAKRYRSANSLSTSGNPAGPTIDIDQLDFNYRIRGDADWRPIRVYNDGTKTVIQMPDTLHQMDAPALVVLGDGNKQQLVNYRVLGDRYIVDLVFNKAALIAGVGRHQVRVTIYRVHKRS